jgi:hypothetical protein
MNDIIMTDFLTAKSSFGLGFASVMNIGGNFFYYNYSPTPAEADARALACDWRMTGRDISLALKHHDPKQRELPLGI